MNFSSDRDLLLYEPQVFNELPFVAQERLHLVDGVLADTTLTSTNGDFEIAQVEPGDVILINGKPHEIISRTDASTLIVSLPRTHLTDTPIPSGDGSELELHLRTFAPQAAIVHDELLRLLKVDPDDSSSILNEDAVVSLSRMARLETLGTLALIYGSGMSLTDDNKMLRVKQAAYRQQFQEACARAVILVDTNNDGFADESRRFGVMRLQRV